MGGWDQELLKVIINNNSTEKSYWKTQSQIPNIKFM